MRFLFYALLVGIGIFCLLIAGGGTAQPNFTLGSIQAAVVGINPSAAVLAKFNRDACLDLAVANEGPRDSRDRQNDTLSILLGACDGTFLPSVQTITVGNRPIAIAQADFNKDGCTDLAVANNLSHTVSIVTTRECTPVNVTMAVAQTLQVPDGPQAVATADFNNDNCPDLAVASFVSTNLGPSSIVSIFIQEPRPYCSGVLPSGPQQTLTWRDGEIEKGPISLAAADFDNDGRVDLAVAHSESNSVAILKGTGQVGAPSKPPFLAGIFTPIQFDNAPWSLEVGYSNGDGNPDLAAVMRYSNNIRIFLGTGAGGFVERPRIPTCSQPIGVANGDFDDDGLEDLAVACFESANVNLYRGQGNGQFDFVVTIPAPASTPGAVNVTDVVVGQILSGQEDPAKPVGKDECDDIAFLVASNTPMPPTAGTVTVQPVICSGSGP